MSGTRGSKFTFIGIAMLIVVLVTAAVIPILPDPRCGKGAKITYIALLKNEWNKRQKKPLTACESPTQS